MTVERRPAAPWWWAAVGTGLLESTALIVLVLAFLDQTADAEDTGPLLYALIIVVACCGYGLGKGAVARPVVAVASTVVSALVAGGLLLLDRDWTWAVLLLVGAIAVGVVVVVPVRLAARAWLTRGVA